VCENSRSLQPSEPLTIPRPSTSGQNKEVQVPTTRKECVFVSDVLVRKAESRSKGATPEPKVRLKKRPAQAERLKSREPHESSSQPLTPGRVSIIWL